MTLNPPEIPVIASIEAIGSGYRAWLVDIWGVMHNGHRAFAAAVAATRAFREQGGIVVFLSNSPRPSPGVQEQLSRLGVPPSCYDATVTSGDLTRHELGKHKHPRVFHLGPERDLPIFAGLDVTLVPREDAELMVCSGLFDDEPKTPDDYVKLLKRACREKSADDLRQSRSPRRARRQARLLRRRLAAIYEQLGGNVVYAGKPHAPIYELALETINEPGRQSGAKHEVLAIGDGVHTDIAGAAGFGIDARVRGGGLHVPANSGGEAGAEALDPGISPSCLYRRRAGHSAAMRALRW